MKTRVRRVKIKRGGDTYGDYHQLVRMYRDKELGPRYEVLAHLGEHSTVEEALNAWPGEIECLRSIGRPNQAEKLTAKLENLRRIEREG